MKFNLHTHTFRCNHATATERDYIERAIDAGLTTLGFSDHSPMPFTGDYYSHFRMKVDLTGDYVDTLLKLREEYRGKIDILIGFEAEYYPKFFPNLIKLLADYPMDYLIMGQHFLDNEVDAHYNGDASDDEQLLDKYVNQVIEGMETGCYTYLAHPDLFRYTGDDATYEKHMVRLCERAKALDVPLELNMLGVWNHRHYPSDRFFNIASQVGNKVVVGIDAHQPERILEENVLADSLAMLKRCNIVPVEDISGITIRKPHL